MNKTKAKQINAPRAPSLRPRNAAAEAPGDLGSPRLRTGLWTATALGDTPELPNNHVLSVFRSFGGYVKITAYYGLFFSLQLWRAWLFPGKTTFSMTFCCIWLNPFPTSLNSFLVAFWGVIASSRRLCDSDPPPRTQHWGDGSPRELGSACHSSNQADPGGEGCVTCRALITKHHRLGGSSAGSPAAGAQRAGGLLQAHSVGNILRAELSSSHLVLQKCYAC